MAEFDKNLVMGMLQNLLGEGEQNSSSNENPFSGSKEPPGNPEQTVSLPVSTGGNNADDLLQTAEIMSKFTDMMGKFRQAGNTREAALLSALRPYLRASRQPKVDTMLRALQAYRVFSQMKKNQ